MRPASEAEKARLNEHVRRALPDPEPVRPARRRSRAHVTRELEAHGPRRRARRARQPARADPRALATARSCSALTSTPSTVSGPIEPVVVDGGWENAHDTILGADNKAAVAVFLEAARRAQRRRLAGRHRAAADARGGERRSPAPRRSTPPALQADFGYVFDHATPIGEVIVASPTYYRLTADFHGRAAHAGIRPEAGRSAILAAAHAIAAMPHGRIDAQTTANVGSIQGGVGSTNVVAERCSSAGRGALARHRTGRAGDRRDDRRGPRRRRGGRVRRRRRRARSSSTATARRAPRRRSWLPRRRCARAATSRRGS